MEKAIAKNKKVFSPKSADKDYKIELYAPALSSSGENSYEPLMTQSSNVDYIQGMGQEASAIVLKSGIKIPVKITYQDLRQKLLDGPTHSETLDLLSITGSICDETEDVKLKEEFNNKSSTSDGRIIEITMFVRSEKGKDHILFSFRNDEVRWEFSREHDANSRGYIQLKNRRGPFNAHKGFWFDITKDDLLERLNKAQMNGDTELDLREETRFKKPSPPRSRHITF